MTDSKHPNSILKDMVPSPLAEDYAGLRILAVHAHPDDESSKGSATMAAYIHRGARVMVATMTGGERGDILNEQVNENPKAHRDLPGVRREEMAEAANIIGIEHRWIGFVDSGLPEGDPLPELPWGSFATLPLEQAAAPLIQLVREYRPHIILSYDERGGYPHPDHIMTHRVAMEAYEKSGDEKAYPQLGKPWEVQKIYYDRAFNPERIRTFHRYLTSTKGESPFTQWVARLDEREEDEKRHPSPYPSHQTTTRISCWEFFETHDRALLAHRSQVRPTDAFFALTPEQQKEIWPWEEYVLAKSRVHSELPEWCFAEGIDYKSSEPNA